MEAVAGAVGRAQCTLFLYLQVALSLRYVTDMFEQLRFNFNENLDFDWDTPPRGEPAAVLIVNCPNCGTKTRHRVSGLRADSQLNCSDCDFAVHLVGDELERITVALDEIFKVLKKSGSFDEAVGGGKLNS